MNSESNAEARGNLIDSEPAIMQPLSIITRMTFAASTSQVWDGLLFYEEIASPPPIHLRLLLPTPMGTEGKVSEVGSEVICRYQGGYLRKRITRIEPEQLYQFEIAEQALSVGGNMRLCGGSYSLRTLAEDKTEVSVETRYTSTLWPHWVWRPFESLVCHWFHRYLLGAIRRKIELP